MQMRAKRIAAVARIGKYIATFHREFPGGKFNIHGKALIGILAFTHRLRHSGRESLQMAVNGHIAIMVHHIERTAIAARLHLGTGNVTVGNHRYRLALDTLRLKIEPRVKMIAAQFRKIPAQIEREIKRHRKLCRLLGTYTRGKQQQCIYYY